MSESILSHYIETEGQDKGRIKDKDIAFELAWTDHAWREEGDGRPINSVPSRLGKHEVRHNDLLETHLAQLIIAKATDEITISLAVIEAQVHDRNTDLEATDPEWVAWRAASEAAAAELETSQSAFPT